MMVSGFTFIRNGRMLGYPFLESIQSILPICDEFVVNVGDSQDDTLEAIRNLGSDKIRITRSTWNENMTDRGFVYAQQKMIAQYQCRGDWLFYIEGDEVVHEDDLGKIRESMERHHADGRVEALVFDYLHFWGNTKTYLWSPAWYRRAARVIRGTIRTHCTDALFWFVSDKSNRLSRYPRAAHAGATMYHYGNARSMRQMVERNRQVSRYWKAPPIVDFEFGNVDPKTLRLFTGTHPGILNGFFPTADGLLQTNPGYRLTRRERRHRVGLLLERLFGIDTSKRHFSIVA